MDTQKPEMGINIELPPEIADGSYVNLAIIAHSPSEFIIDFVRLVPGVTTVKTKHRLIMTPEHAKRLLIALNENITKYEAQYGTISLKGNDYNPPSTHLKA